jgi:anti-anti-sigma factor
MPQSPARPNYRPRPIGPNQRHVTARTPEARNPGRSGPAVVISLRGTVDYTTAPMVREAISAAVTSTPQPTEIVLDMSDVTGLDSTGLGNIVVGYRICRHVGVKLTVRDPSPLVRKLFDAAGVGRTLTR